MFMENREAMVEHGSSVADLETRLSIYRMMQEGRLFEKRAQRPVPRGPGEGDLAPRDRPGGGRRRLRRGAASPRTWCSARTAATSTRCCAARRWAALMAELLGRATGICGGKGGSMHLTDVSHGAMGSYAIVGAHMPIAAGAAWAAQARGTGQVAVCFFGDGTTNIGTFHEALNLAAVWKLPVVFVCENNLYMEYTAIGDVTAVEHPGRGPRIGLRPGADPDRRERRRRGPRRRRVRAVARARAGDGPSLVEAVTYRHGGHSRADPAKYRPDEEVAEWMGRDPIPILPRAAARGGRRRGDAWTGSTRRAAARSTGATEEARDGAVPRSGHARDRALGRRRLRVAELTYREAVARAIAQEMERDPSVFFIGEDVAAAGGVFKTTEGLLERFGPERVRDTPISEQAIIGAAMGAAMNGLRPIAELMFSDFFAVCWDIVANQIAKARYMTNGQVALPIVIRTANGGGVRFGAQHSQSVETWMMAIPGLKVVVPSTPLDMIGLFAAAVRDPDPVDRRGAEGAVRVEGRRARRRDRRPSSATRARVRDGEDVTICALGAMVPKALEAAERLADDGVSADVIDVRSLVPLDVRAIAGSVERTGHLVTVEENPRLCGWGAEIASIVADEAFFALDGPIVRVTTPHLPLPSADVLEDAAIPSVDRIVEGVRRSLG